MDGENYGDAPKRGAMYGCPWCGEDFSSRVGLLRHIRRGRCPELSSTDDLEAAAEEAKELVPEPESYSERLESGFGLLDQDNW